VNGCYKAVNRNLFWTAAALECRTLHKDAHLVVINNAEENAAVAEMLVTINKSNGQFTSTVLCRVLLLDVRLTTDVLYLTNICMTLTLIQPASKWMHWATLRRHSCPSRAATSASSQVSVIFRRSFLTVPIQLALGRPGPLWKPGTCQYSACCGIRRWSIRRT